MFYAKLEPFVTVSSIGNVLFADGAWCGASAVFDDDDDDGGRTDCLNQDLRDGRAQRCSVINVHAHCWLATGLACVCVCTFYKCICITLQLDL